MVRKNRAKAILNITEIGTILSGDAIIKTIKKRFTMRNFKVKLRFPY
jgi:hypothetical protein